MLLVVFVVRHFHFVPIKENILWKLISCSSKTVKFRTTIIQYVSKIRFVKRMF